MNDFNPPILVSACLVGLCSRYDGISKTSAPCCEYLNNKVYIPCCPEQLGGLPTPREAADLVGGDGYAVLRGEAKVITKSGIDVTQAFIHGAEQVLLLARSQHITEALLKARSPSCAVQGLVGVTAALLSLHGVQLSEY